MDTTTALDMIVAEAHRWAAMARDARAEAARLRREMKKGRTAARKLQSIVARPTSTRLAAKEGRARKAAPETPAPTLAPALEMVAPVAPAVMIEPTAPMAVQANVAPPVEGIATSVATVAGESDALA